MDLLPGARVGAFEIVGPLGVGGMGEVYRARDTRLGRDVALKALPVSVSQDAKRLSRFDREARVLATLNHPGIGAIYGVEESSRGPLLVLELVPGPTLQDRIGRGALPIREAVSICRQIAEAVAFAHASGVVHRDLKPANVKCTPDGRVKVLDFGLAKAVLAEAGVEPDDATRTAGGTGEGVVLGTPAYMSPEQARGEKVDRRSDIWSLGLILYEALAGRNPFQRATSSDTLVAVLDKELDWSALPASTPWGIRALLRRCLERDRDRRMHDMADVRIELEEALASPLETPLDPGSARRLAGRARALEIGAVGVLVLSLAFHLTILSRLVGPLAGLHGEVALSLSLPLRAYLNASKWVSLALGAMGLLWAAFALVGRPFLARIRQRLLVATAAVVAVATMGGSWLVAEQAVFQALRLNQLAKGKLLERDLASLHIAAGQPSLAVSLIDPQGARDYPEGELKAWGAGGQVFQLAEAYRAMGDLEAARRLYGRALEAATIFDETLSQRALSQEEWWQAESGLDLEGWKLSISQLRKLPAALRAAVDQRLRQLADEPRSTRPPAGVAPR